MEVTVICPKHGEHEHAITSNIPGHEGAWCQLCWLESLGPSMPYRTRKLSALLQPTPEPEVSQIPPGL